MFIQDLLYGTINAFKKAAYGYDDFGLRYSKHHLEMMFPKILSIPIEEQSEYADFVTVTNVNKDWLMDNLRDFDIDTHGIAMINTTSVGNVAYIALNCCDKEVRNNALKNLEKIKEYFKNKK
mgnify:CR=1 FL=1